jgi:hypothetical protein
VCPKITARGKVKDDGTAAGCFYPRQENDISGKSPDCVLPEMMDFGSEQGLSDFETAGIAGIWNSPNFRIISILT